MPVYHVWFATRSRKWIMQGEVAETAKRLMSEIAREKAIALVEIETIVDHVHLLLECDGKESLSRALFHLKGGSSYRLNLAYPELRLDAQTLHIWQKGYGSKIIASRDIPMVRRYIQTQWDRLEKYDRPNRLKD